MYVMGEFPDLSLEFEGDQITQPIGRMPLNEAADYSTEPMEIGTPCYFCDDLARVRLKTGHPVCREKAHIKA